MSKKNTQKRNAVLEAIKNDDEDFDIDPSLFPPALAPKKPKTTSKKSTTSKGSTKDVSGEVTKLLAEIKEILEDVCETVRIGFTELANRGDFTKNISTQMSSPNIASKMLTSLERYESDVYGGESKIKAETSGIFFNRIIVGIHKSLRGFGVSIESVSRGLKNLASTLKDSARNIFSGLFQEIDEASGGVYSLVGNIVKPIVSVISPAIDDAKGRALGKATSTIDRIFGAGGSFNSEIRESSKIEKREGDQTQEQIHLLRKTEIREGGRLQTEIQKSSSRITQAISSAITNVKTITNRGGGSVTNRDGGGNLFGGVITEAAGEMIGRKFPLFKFSRFSRGIGGGSGAVARTAPSLLGASTAAMGGATKGVGALTKLSGMVGRLGSLVTKGIAAIPAIGWVIAGVIAIASGLAKAVGKFLTGERNIGNLIGSFFSGILSFLTFGILGGKEIERGLQDMFQPITQIFDSIMDLVKTVYRELEPALRESMKIVEPVFKILKILLNGMLLPIKMWVKMTSFLMSKTIKPFAYGVTKIINVITGTLSLIADGFQKLVDYLSDIPGIGWMFKGVSSKSSASESGSRNENISPQYIRAEATRQYIMNAIGTTSPNPTISISGGGGGVGSSIVERIGSTRTLQERLLTEIAGTTNVTARNSLSASNPRGSRANTFVQTNNSTTIVSTPMTVHSTDPATMRYAQTISHGLYGIPWR